jgi:3-methylcrotonyl-CoA carboxylase alpha subunit
VATNSETAILAPFAGTVIAIAHAPQEPVRAGSALLILEAMKMEHTICAPANGTVRGYRAAVGEQVKEGWDLIDFEAGPPGPKDEPVRAGAAST